MVAAIVIAAIALYYSNSLLLVAKPTIPARTFPRDFISYQWLDNVNIMCLKQHYGTPVPSPTVLSIINTETGAEHGAHRVPIRGPEEGNGATCSDDARRPVVCRGFAGPSRRFTIIRVDLSGGACERASDK